MAFYGGEGGINCLFCWGVGGDMVVSVIVRLSVSVSLESVYVLVCALS